MQDFASTTTLLLYIFAANQLITGASSPKCWVAAVWCASASEMEAQGPSKRSERNWPSDLTPDAMRHEAMCLSPSKAKQKSKHTSYYLSDIYCLNSSRIASVIKTYKAKPHIIWERGVAPTQQALKEKPPACWTSIPILQSTLFSNMLSAGIDAISTWKAWDGLSAWPATPAAARLP